MGNADLTPEVEAIEKDIQAMEELQEQSDTNPKEKSQVTSFTLK